MPTRPVTWELDVPPASLLKPAGKTPRGGEAPSLHKLRNSLMGARFELLKVSMFAVFLLAFVGVAIHESQLANPDNQYGANAGAAIKGLAVTLLHQTAAVRGRTEAFALAAIGRIDAAVRHAPPLAPTPSSPAAVRPVPALAAKHAMDLARVHAKTHAAQSGRVESISPRSHSASAALRDTPSMLKNLLSPDSLAAGVVGLLLYILFAVVLVRKKGGLRAFS